MAKVDSTIKAETKNIAICVLILSALMEAVFLVTGMWDYTVLLGNLLGGAAGILNFFLMGVGIQNALDKDQKGAKATVSFSRTYRQLVLAAVMVAGLLAPCFNAVATILAVFFASFGVYLRVIIMKKKGVDVNETSTSSDKKEGEES